MMVPRNDNACFLFAIIFALSVIQYSEARIKHFRPITLPQDLHIPAWMLARHNVTEADLVSGHQNRTLGSIISWIQGLWSGAGTGGTGGTGGTEGGITSEVTSSETSVVSSEGSLEDVTMETCDCRCGISSTRLKIVGGQETRVNQYPWMAMLTYDGRFYCGAALINSNYVLTAAHCVSGFSSRRIEVRLMEHNTASSSDTTLITRKVRTATPHPRYSSSTFNNDIALLRLDREVPIKGEVLPVCLPEKGKRFTGEQAIVTGWGKTGESKPVSTVLREVQVPIMSNTKCSSYYGRSQITDNMLCAGVSQGGKDSCQGDSGGPLHIKNSTSHHIAGVVSWGEGCARPNNPGVYARVNRYLSWISATTRGTCFCTPS